VILLQVLLKQAFNWLRRDQAVFLIFLGDLSFHLDAKDTKPWFLEQFNFGQWSLVATLS